MQFAGKQSTQRRGDSEDREGEEEGPLQAAESLTRVPPLQRAIET